MSAQDRIARLIRLIFFLLACLSPGFAAAGWDSSRHAIPLDEIQAGGPPKDGTTQGAVIVYWFVWKGMFPQSTLYKQPEQVEPGGQASK